MAEDYKREYLLYSESEDDAIRAELRKTQSLRRSFTSILGGLSTFFAGLNPLFVAPMLKYFQIIEFLSNIGKVNVEFKSNLAILFEVLEEMKIPEINFLRKLGPI